MKRLVTLLSCVVLVFILCTALSGCDIASSVVTSGVSYFSNGDGTCYAIINGIPGEEIVFSETSLLGERVTVVGYPESVKDRPLPSKYMFFYHFFRIFFKSKTHLYRWRFRAVLQRSVTMLSVAMKA